MQEKGGIFYGKRKKMITVVGAYMILKGILNLILGFSASNVVSLLFASSFDFCNAETDSI